MDSRDRVFDNMFIERFWRSVKCKGIYINSYETVKDNIRELTSFIITKGSMNSSVIGHLMRYIANMKGGLTLPPENKHVRDNQRNTLNTQFLY